MLEAVARMAYLTLSINHAAEPIGQDLHDKHYLRKHGSKAYYGQRRDCT
jgi:L-ribulose-5-phosphate 4-epimerase